jgi:anaerobic carbon-monoxide dehydrogenase iron sulfur subunit
MKHIIVDPARCTGCESCVLNCSFAHTSAISLNQSRILIERDEEQAAFRPRVCTQCDGRFCVKACPVDALSVDPLLGCIRVDEARCIGCRACAAACPFGGVQFVDSRPLPLICDLCGGDPACVATCRKPQALRYATRGEADD